MSGVKSIPMQLCYATCFDLEHPPSNAIEPDETSFWMTTGLFPQEIVFKFNEPIRIVRVSLIVGKTKNVNIQSASDPELNSWMEIDSFTLPANPVKQKETHQLDLRSVSYGLKVTIEQGWGPFAALYLTKVEGTVAEANK